MSVNIEPVAGSLGAEIHGINLSQELSNMEASTVHDAFLRHRVLFFRDQTLTPHQQLRFTRLFGEPDTYPFMQGLEEAPEVIDIIKTETDEANFGGSWHSDTAYLPKPARGTVLYALEVPDAGGDTLFANTAAAYAALSDGMRAMVDGLYGVNSSEKRLRWQPGKSDGATQCDERGFQRNVRELRKCASDCSHAS